MPLSNITLNDTIDVWRTRDNQSANALNLLETGGSSGVSPYTKSNGAFLLTGNSSIVVSANGTALQVANSVLFSTDLEVGKNITLGSQSAQTGNLTIGANTFIYGKGTALYVANNVLANLNLQVTNNITTSNISTNNDVSIGRNASIVNKLSMTGTGNVVFVNVGSASINTAYLTDMLTTNAKATRVTIYDTLDVTGLTTHLANVYGTDINLSAGANSYTLNVRTNGTVFGNLNTGNTVTSNTTATGNLRVTTSANVDGTLRVTGGSNLVSTLRVTDAANLESTLNAVGAANLGSTLNATGDTNLGSTLRVAGAANVVGTLRVTGAANLESTMNVAGAANLDSTLRVTGAANLDSTLRVAGSANVAGAANVVGTIRVTGGANLDSTLRVAGAANLESTMNVAGAANLDSTLRVTGAANLDSTLRVSGAANVVGTIRVTAAANLESTLNVAGNTESTNFNTTGLVYANALRVIGASNLVSTLRVTGAANLDSTLRVAGAANLESTMNVAGNTESTNFNTTGLVYANALRTVGRADVGGPLVVTGATTLSTGQATGNFAVQGDFTINGSVIYNTNQLVLSVATPNQDTKFATYRTNNSLSLANSVAQNAFVRWNETQKYWDLTTDPANNVIYQILDAGRLSSDLTNTSAIIISTASAANTLNTRTATAGSYANSAYTQANTAYSGTTGTHANSAFAIANTAYSGTTGTHANSAYAQANTAYSGTIGTHANSAYAHANSAYATANAKADYSFVTIAANGTSLVADAASDTLTITSAMANGIFVTGTSSTDTFDIGLLNTGVTAGTYGDSTTVGQFTVDGKGRLTAASGVGIRAASTSVSGIVQLEDSTSSTSTTTAATANTVKSAYDLASGKIASVSITTTAPITGGTTGSSFTLAMPAATTSVNGYMTSTFASKLDGIAASATNVTNNNQLTNGAGYVTSSGVTSVSVTAPVSSTGGTTPTISMAAATTSVSGYLTSTDWTTFNNKQASGSYVTSGGALGTPSSGTLTNCTFPTLNQNTTGTASNITSYTINQSVGSSNSPTFAGLTINGAITATGDITGGTSDARLKTNILPITDALSKVNRISGVTYNMSDLASSLGIGNTEDRVGVIAQELEQVLPQVVKPAPFDTDKDGNSISGANYKTVQYEKIVPLLIEAIKELTAKVNMLEEQINK